MEHLTLRLAAPKSMQLKMEPQSSETMPAKTENSVTQNIVLKNPNKVRRFALQKLMNDKPLINTHFQQEPLRLRYKVTYQQFGVDMELSGDYSAQK